MPNRLRHTILSFIKSGFRLLAFGLLMHAGQIIRPLHEHLGFDFYMIGAGLLLAEIVGIVEEL